MFRIKSSFILLFILSVLLGSQKVMAEPIEQLKLTPADLLVQNNTGGIIRVNDIKLQETQNGLELILITDSGQRLVPLILPEGNNLVIDLLDARLDLATGDNFRVDNPAPGIRAIIATQVDERNIRLTIEGENNTPSAEIVPNRQNLVLSIFSYEF